MCYLQANKNTLGRAVCFLEEPKANSFPVVYSEIIKHTLTDQRQGIEIVPSTGWGAKSSAIASLPQRRCSSKGWSWGFAQELVVCTIVCALNFVFLSTFAAKKRRIGNKVMNNIFAIFLHRSNRSQLSAAVG